MVNIDKYLPPAVMKHQNTARVRKSPSQLKGAKLEAVTNPAVARTTSQRPLGVVRFQLPHSHRNSATTILRPGDKHGHFSTEADQYQLRKGALPTIDFQKRNSIGNFK